MRSEDATRLPLATVLLVDADAGSLAAAQAGLEAAGYGTVESTTDCARTAELLGTHEPDVLLLAAHRQQPDAFDILARLRGDEQWRHLPVIMLVAGDDSAGKRQAVELGATDILSTPLDASELVLRLRNALGFKAYQDRLLKRDPLTGLANRVEFMRRVQAALARTPLADTPLADAAPPGPAQRSLLLLNLDRFKQINDSIGHAAGDSLLIAISQRLSAVVARHSGGNRRADGGVLTPWLARLDGDRFMALLPGAAGTAGHQQAMREIVECVAAPVHLNRREFHVSASIGVAWADGTTAEILIQCAELALSHAKKRGGNAVEYFTAEMQNLAAERLSLENHLRYAIRRGELRLHYQPKVDCASLRIVGVEALIRWQHPVQGLIPPQRFIALAEEAGLIDAIGEWALREACRQGAQWMQANLPPIQVAVNLSAAQLLQADLAANLGRILADSGFAPSRLTLELTESMLMRAGDEAERTIGSLKALGVALSLDDFGTGYSPLTYLRRLPIDEIKIDRSFVHGLPAQRDSAAIAGAIITLGGALGLQVVAEGVETAAELDFLRQFSQCRFQGQLFSQPLPGEALTAMLAAVPKPMPGENQP